MKKTVLATALALMGSFAALSSYGQGSVIFENYDFGALNAPVTFGNTANVGGVNGVTGQGIGSEFTAALMYSLDGGATYTLLSQGAAGAGAAYPTAFSGTDGNAASGASYFLGPTVTIPGYSSGPVNFIVQAYHGASYATADWKGQSAAFTDPSLATGQTPASQFPGGSLQAFVVTVPEPSIFALAGLGAAGLMAFRRKKA
jgi:hypothetical protein